MFPLTIKNSFTYISLIYCVLSFQTCERYLRMLISYARGRGFSYRGYVRCSCESLPSFFPCLSSAFPPRFHRTMHIVDVSLVSPICFCQRLVRQILLCSRLAPSSISAEIRLPFLLALPSLMSKYLPRFLSKIDFD